MSRYYQKPERPWDSQARGCAGLFLAIIFLFAALPQFIAQRSIGYVIIAIVAIASGIWMWYSERKNWND